MHRALHDCDYAGLLVDSLWGWPDAAPDTFTAPTHNAGMRHDLDEAIRYRRATKRMKVAVPNPPLCNRTVGDRAMH